MSLREIEPATLLAMYGADLAAVFAKLPQAQADRAIDELAAGIKEAADAMRNGEPASVRQ